MPRRIVIVGGVAGGASSAARLRRLNEEDEIIMFEKGPNVSFSNCSLPYYLSGVVETADELVMMSPEKFMKQYKIDARVNQEVVAINREAKTLTVKNLQTTDEYNLSYDKLILSPGANPIKPKFEGLEKVNVYTIRNVVDIKALKNAIDSNSSNKVAVIGGGYIGVEVAENLAQANYDVTLIEAANQILRPFDYDMVQIFHKELMDHGVKLIVDDKVQAFDTNKIMLASGKVVETANVVLAIGVTPETNLAKDCGLEIGTTGAIKVNQYYQTSDDDIYAVGDAIEVIHGLSLKPSKISLAGPAQKQARMVANHINGLPVNDLKYLGTSAIKVFDYNGASTGLNEALIEVLQLDVDYQVIHFILNDKVSLMPDAHPLFFKLLYETNSGKILGAQAIGKGNVDKRIDVIATAIQFNGVVSDLKDLDLSYAPPFSTAKDIVNYAGFIGDNLMHKAFKQITVDTMRNLVADDACIIDVREVGEFNNGHIINAINIPLSQLRERYSEIPQDQTVYIHCRSGQRSYNAVMALQNLGYDNVVNVTGGFLALSYYEYFNDVTLKREPIVTEYNFN